MAAGVFSVRVRLGWTTVTLMPARAELLGQVLGQRHHRDVANAADDRAGAARGEAADVDDPPPALVDHVRRDLARTAQVAHHFDVDVGVEGVVGDLGQFGRRRLTAGLRRAVDQDVDAAERRGGLLDHALDRFVAAGVGDDRHDAAAGRLGQLGRGLLEGVLRASDDGDVDALSRQLARDGFANSTAAAGHDGGLACKLQVHTFAAKRTAIGWCVSARRYPGRVATALGPLDPPRRLLMGSGPSNPEPRVLQAMTAAPIAPDDPAFQSLLDDVAALGRAVFQTTNALHAGSARRLALGHRGGAGQPDRAGRRVLVGVYGHFGELLRTLAARHGAQVERVEAPRWGAPVDVDQIVEAVRRGQPKLVAIVHADTSTGILQPLAAIGAACREAGSLFVVDAVLSLGGCAVDVDGWRIDAAIGGLQKCLGGPPGLAPLAYSERARQVARRTHDAAAQRLPGPAPPRIRLARAACPEHVGHVDADAAGCSRGAAHRPGRGSVGALGASPSGQSQPARRLAGDGPRALRRRRAIGCR